MGQSTASKQNLIYFYSNIMIYCDVCSIGSEFWMVGAGIVLRVLQ